MCAMTGAVALPYQVERWRVIADGSSMRAARVASIAIA
jgi:hypothetical protein